MTSGIGVQGAPFWNWQLIGVGAPLILALGAGAVWGHEYNLGAFLFLASIGWVTAKAARDYEPVRAIVAGSALFTASLLWIQSHFQPIEAPTTTQRKGVQTPSLDSPPIVLDAVTFDGPVRPGQPLGLRLYFTNNAGRALLVRKSGTIRIVPAPKTEFEKTELEEDLWKNLITHVKSVEPTELPSGAPGKIFKPLSTNPLGQQDAGEIKDGRSLVYYAYVIVDAPSGKNLFEFCGRESPATQSVELCNKHNLP